MPILDLKCKSCTHEFEYFKIKSDDTPRCVHCGSSDLENLPPKGTGIVFKGSGFYVTDYKKGKRR